MRAFVVFLVFLLIVVVVADRALHSAAQNMIAERVAQQTGMTEEPDVGIGGFAFLPQAVRGTYSEITISADSMQIGEYTLEQVDVLAEDVDAPLSDLLTQPQVVAGSMTGSTVLPYSEVVQELPEGVAIENENGQPRLTGEVAVPQWGISVTVSSGAEFAVEENTLYVRPVDLEIGDAPVDISGLVEGMLVQAYAIPQLPFGLRITDVEATPSGVRFSGEGEDVPLMGSRT